MLNNLLFFVAGVLTTFVLIVIIGLRNNRNRAKVDNIKQSSIFMEMKTMMPDVMDFYLNRSTQAQHYEANMSLKYIQMSDNKVYWLKGNNIYYAETKSDGRVVMSEGKKIQMTNLSEKEVAKTLFIYNSLKNG